MTIASFAKRTAPIDAKIMLECYSETGHDKAGMEGVLIVKDCLLPSAKSSNESLPAYPKAQPHRRDIKASHNHDG